MPFPQGSQIFDTPKKARVRGAVDFCDAMGIPYYKTDVFRFNGVSRQRGYEFLAESDTRADRTHHNSELNEEKRGRPLKLSPKDLERCDRFLQQQGWDARVLTWDSLAQEMDFDCTGYTLREAMGSMDYHKCVACNKGWVSQRTAKARVEFAQNMLAAYPDPIHWRRVRFSDEVHWSIGPEGKMRILRKPGERYCSDCIQHTTNREEEKKLQRQHSWAAVGFNFKSNLHFYKVPSNKNGKMSLKVYRDSILEPIVKPWLQRGDDFVLEEDNDSGHGTGKSNCVRSWKKKNGLDYYFNCPSSPDLSPIENCWQPPKQFLKKFPHWDEFETRELVIEGWGNVSQKFINERVNSIPQRLQDCIDMGGEMTGY